MLADIIHAGHIDLLCHELKETRYPVSLDELLLAATEQAPAVARQLFTVILEHKDMLTARPRPGQELWRATNLGNLTELHYQCYTKDICDIVFCMSKLQAALDHLDNEQFDWWATMHIREFGWVMSM